MKRDQIPSLTGLRFFAAAAVVLSHALTRIVIYDDPPYLVLLISQASGIGMTLFFVLSGFVIFLNYSRSIGSGTDLWNFFVARFARLYPLFFVCVAFDLLMRFSYSRLSLGQMAAALPFYATLTQSWLYTIVDGHSLIFQFGLMPQVSWSISTEWLFYFAFPFICAAIWFLKTTRARLLGIVAISAIALTLSSLINFNTVPIQAWAVEKFGTIAVDPTDSFYLWLTYFSPYVRIFEFILGCICASIYMALDPPSAREERVGVYVTAFSICAIVGLHIVFFGVDFQNPYARMLIEVRRNYGFALPEAVLVFCCARYQNAIVRFMSGTLIVLGGEISYSIYLLHDLIINAFRYEAVRIASWQIAVGSYVQLIAVLASIAGLSLVSWRFIEVPCRRVLRSLLSVKQSVASQVEAEGAVAESGTR